MPEVHAILSASSSKRWLNLYAVLDGWSRIFQMNPRCMPRREPPPMRWASTSSASICTSVSGGRPPSSTTRRWMPTPTSMPSSSSRQWRRLRRLVRIRWSWWRNGWITATSFRRDSGPATGDHRRRYSLRHGL